jgi:hypothetical protein
MNLQSPVGRRGSLLLSRLSRNEHPATLHRRMCGVSGLSHPTVFIAAPGSCRPSS